MSRPRVPRVRSPAPPRSTSCSRRAPSSCPARRNRGSTRTSLRRPLPMLPLHERRQLPDVLDSLDWFLPQVRGLPVKDDLGGDGTLGDQAGEAEGLVRGLELVQFAALEDCPV